MPLFVKPKPAPHDYRAHGQVAGLDDSTAHSGAPMTHAHDLRLPLLTFGLLGIAAIQPATALQDGPDRWLVSTTDNLKVSGLMETDDAALTQIASGLAPHTYFAQGNWFALAGFQPGDIDAVGLLPDAAGGDWRGALAFSLLSNEEGFLDGDVLGISPGGGVFTLVPEGALAALLGTPNASIDIDALDYDNQGRLLFSLQSFLAGTVLGNVENGDILRLEPDGTLSRPFTEADVQLAYDNSGGPAGAVGDVQGLTAFGAELYVALQSPSASDGTILKLGDAPSLVATEDSFGLGGAEIDALTALDSAWDVGAIALDIDISLPGAFVHAEGHGFTPAAPVLLLMAGQPGFDSSFGLAGFGELFLDLSDPWFLLSSSAAGLPVVGTDATGSFALDFQLPVGEWGGSWMGGQGWSFQALDLANLALTAPFRVQLL
jgi:hypothetical protein